MKILNVGYSSTNYYLLDNNKTTLLVDAGWPGTLSKFVHVLRNRGLGLKDIAWFLVTHFHPDHAGLVQELKDAGSRFILLEGQMPALARLGQMIKPEQPYRQIRSGDESILAIKDSRAFLQKLGFEGEIVPTPGHSDDSMTLVLDTGQAFTGDLTPEFMAPDNRELRQSWQRLRTLEVRKIYPGHGPVHLTPPIHSSGS
jgi:endoribonuclease LACTB2